MSSVETKYCKQIQSRANSQGYRITLSDARYYYSVHVANNGNKPTENEFTTILDEIKEKAQSMSGLTIPKTNQITDSQDVLAMSNSITSSTVSNTLKLDSGVIHQTHTKDASGELTTVTQNDIRQAVEQQFGRENVETKQAILNYVAQDTFATASELQTALGRLRTMRLDILLKLISDYNSASNSDESLLKTALSNASAKRQQETTDFFDSFERQLVTMRNTFKI